MPLVSIREELKKAQAGQYAVPLYDVFEMRAVEGVFAALQEKHAPTIVAIYAQYIDLPNAEAFATFIRTMARNAAVPVSLMLDHGTSFEQCVKALYYGFTDVMYDGSSLPLEQNVANTRLVAHAAHAVGASIEGELGHVGRGAEYGEFGAQGKGLTNPELVEQFVAETGVDFLAIAIGNAHGVYKGEPHLDLKLLQEIRRIADVPLVLHGGSGLTDEQFRAAIAAGICKVNVSTDLKTVATRMAAEATRLDDPSYFYYMNEGVREAYRQRSTCYYDLFGTSGRA